MKTICVYCAGSPRVDPEFVRMTKALGAGLVERGITLVYGAGATGLMGALAYSVLESGGKVIGVIPEFMTEREWNHPHITETHVVESMHERKQLMIDLSEGFVTLPGGSGTIEEVTECISFRRLGLHPHPIFIANWKRYYDPLLAQFEAVFGGDFLEPEFRGLYSTFEELDALFDAIDDPPAFDHPWTD